MSKHVRAALLAIALALPLLFGKSALAEYPDRPIRFIVPYAAGGSSDIVARNFAEFFQKAIGESVVIENVGGAAGYAGAQRVARSAPDGYTLLIGAGSELLIRNLVQKNPVPDPLKEFTPISLIGAGPMVLVGKPDLKPSALQDVVALSNSQPSGLNYGSAGFGTFMHLVGEAVKVRTQSKITHVPYKGAAPLMTDVIGSHVDLGVSSLAGALPFIRGGQAKAYAVSSLGRTEFAPEIPALSEFPAFRDFSLELWIGLFGPAGMTDELVAKIRTAALKALDEPGLKERLGSQAIAVRKLAGAEFSAFLEAENAKYKKIITDADVKPE